MGASMSQQNGPPRPVTGIAFTVCLDAILCLNYVLGFFNDSRPVDPVILDLTILKIICEE
jgi:hypothetical protein